MSGHQEIVRISREFGAELLLQMEDYYRDARFEVAELGVLEDELREVLSRVRSDFVEHSALKELLKHMLTLVAWARESQRVIEVICD